jgi:hypothetical protein
MLKDDKPGQYTFEALMELDIVRAYEISVEELRDLVVDAGNHLWSSGRAPHVTISDHRGNMRASFQEALYSSCGIG